MAHPIKSRLRKPAPEGRPSRRHEPEEELSPEEQQKRLLDRLAQGAALCKEVEASLKNEPSPEMETILRLHRILVLKLSAEAQGAPELLRLANVLMKPLLEWARLEESRKGRELAEQKYRDEKQARQAEKEKQQPVGERALKPDTLEKIERELRLF